MINYKRLIHSQIINLRVWEHFCLFPCNLSSRTHPFVAPLPSSGPCKWDGTTCCTCHTLCREDWGSEVSGTRRIIPSSRKVDRGLSELDYKRRDGNRSQGLWYPIHRTMIQSIHCIFQKYSLYKFCQSDWQGKPHYRLCTLGLRLIYLASYCLSQPSYNT